MHTPDHERFAKFLENHLDEVFPFLRNADVVSATNHESESELQFNVIARKLSGGNRSDSGVAAQESLPSVIRTCRKLIRDPFEYLLAVLTLTTPVPLFPETGRSSGTAFPSSASPWPSRLVWTLWSPPSSSSSPCCCWPSESPWSSSPSSSLLSEFLVAQHHQSGVRHQ